MIGTLINSGFSQWGLDPVHPSNAPVIYFDEHPDPHNFNALLGAHHHGATIRVSCIWRAV
eukprot:363882-Chlamydomonas_euryale.AAC.7